MRTFTGIADLEAVVGTHIGYSDWHTIDQERINTFAQATGDFQWIHTDAEKAAAGPYGTTIAHGFLTVSLLPMLLWEIYDLQGVSASLNYGLDKVRFPAPVPVDSRVRGGLEIVSITPHAAGSMVLNRVTIEIDGHPKPACVADMLSLIVPA